MLNTDLKTVIESKSPDFFQKLPTCVSHGLLRFLERLVHADELQDFFRQHGEKTHVEFIEAVFAFLDFSYTVSDQELRHIPAHGRVICVANHATGPLDGLILLHLLSRVRQDVKIVVTDILAELHQLRDLFLVYDQYTAQLQRQNIAAIRQALQAEQAVIFFPAGEVTKLSRHGLRESSWMTGPVSLARKYRVPVLPVALRARNSLLYYLTAKIHRHLATLLLSHEMFRQRSHAMPLTIGHLLPADDFQILPSDITQKTRQVQDLVARLKNGIY